MVHPTIYHLGFIDNQADAERMIERSIELGVRFFDNARRYVNGRAEEYMGKFLTPKYRDQIFLMTKAPGRTGDEVRQMLDESLTALKTDYLDLWQIHNLTTLEEVDRRIKAVFILNHSPRWAIFIAWVIPPISDT